MFDKINVFLNYLSNKTGISRDIIKIALIFVCLFLITNILESGFTLNTKGIMSNALISFSYITIIIMSVIFHETSHGYAAYLLGDPTAKNMGRLSLNPLKHIRLPALFAMFAVMLLGINNIFIYIIIGISFAKPVPFNPIYFKNPRKQSALVALAGPLSNFVLVIAGFLILKLFVQLGVFSNETPYLILTVEFIKLFIYINIYLAMFNLVPILPLDGGRILYGILPEEIAKTYATTESIGFIIIIVLWYFDLFRFIAPVAINIFNFLGRIII
ncbi:MAG: site-2 protease family protein [Candidatus Muirbacterium halophilum]|nr:site-2 protease family protein [Candidatus Muirbacterium halophilum]MCK9475660.1 site-2 protease family protein [Candidatus Muirbacterium halophilum]